MTKRIFLVAALLMLVLQGTFAGQFGGVFRRDKKDRQELEVHAISYRAFPHENLNASTFATCYGAGADSAFWTTLRMNCTAMTTPPPVVVPWNVHSVEVYNLVEANGSIYAITCGAAWVGSECTWLAPGAVFEAEVEDWTMWVETPMPGAHGKNKEIRRKFSLLEVLRAPDKVPSPAPPTGDVVLPGSYFGVIRSAPLGVAVRFGIAIRTDKGSLNGCLSLQPPLNGSGVIQGTVQGKDISFDAVGPNYVLKFRGALQGPDLKGIYAVAPEDDGGAFVLRKVNDSAPPAGFDVKDCLKTLMALDPPGPFAP